MNARRRRVTLNGFHNTQKSYGRFLIDLSEDLMEMIRECENFNFHHQAEGSEKWNHYNRLLQWSSEVIGRLAYYDAAKKNRS